MLSRTPFSSARGQQTASRICASCFFAQRSLAIEKQRRSQSTEAKSTTNTANTASTTSTANTASTEKTDTKPKHRRRGREVKPHPAPPNPPWPKSPSSRTPTVRNYMTPRALAENAIFVGRTSGRLQQQAAALAREAQKLRDEGGAGQGSHSKGLNVLVGVPRMPDLESYYTCIGPGVVAPWQPGGVSFTPLNMDAQTMNSLGGPKRMGVRLRVCNMHVIHPYSIKFLYSFDDIAPTGAGQTSTFQSFSPSSSSSNSYRNSYANNQYYNQNYNQEPDSLTHSGFPHCLAEVVRRWYANKNRTDPLWWYVSLASNENAGGADLATVKNILRSKMHAKVQHAFKTALARRGYSPSGRRLHDESTSQDGEEQVVAKHAHLFGSVRVDAVLQRVLEASYEDLVAYMTSLVPGIEADLGGKGEVVDGALVYTGRGSYRTYKTRTIFQPWPKPERR